jgi:hypothetical protein
MFTSGPLAGEATGSWCGEPLFHASLDPSEYTERLRANGFSVLSYLAEDPDCGGHTVWLTKYGSSAPDAGRHLSALRAS